MPGGKGSPQVACGSSLSLSKNSRLSLKAIVATAIDDAVNVKQQRVQALTHALCLHLSGRNGRAARAFNKHGTLEVDCEQLNEAMPGCPSVNAYDLEALRAHLGTSGISVARFGGTLSISMPCCLEFSKDSGDRINPASCWGCGDSWKALLERPICALLHSMYQSNVSEVIGTFFPLFEKALEEGKFSITSTTHILLTVGCRNCILRQAEIFMAYLRAQGLEVSLPPGVTETSPSFHSLPLLVKKPLVGDGDAAPPSSYHVPGNSGKKKKTCVVM